MESQLEIAEDADVGKFLSISVGIQAQQEAPLEGHEAPHTGEIEARRVSRGLLLCDGKREEGDEGGDGQNWEHHGHGHEELEAFEPGAPVVLDVHDVRDEGPESQNTRQASHGRRPRLFVGDVPRQESRQSDQGAEGGIPDADVNPIDSHRCVEPQ